MKKYLTILLRIAVGLLFVVSGLIKLNDPTGFSFKLEEYFSPAVLNMPFLSFAALPLAFFVSIAETILGVALLVGFRPRFTLTALLAMLVFFGFLTFYSAYYNKVTDCGCFGDAISLTPWQTFSKDLVLFAFAVILWLLRSELTSVFSKKTNLIVTASALVCCLALGFYSTSFLPLIDFRPYKVGVNIEKAMSVPEGAAKNIYEYQWKFKDHGKELVISNLGDYPETDAEYVGVTTKLIQKGYVPPIHDFTMERNGTDEAATLLKAPKLFIITSYDVMDASESGWERVISSLGKAREHGYKTIVLSASSPEHEAFIQKKYDLTGVEFYHADNTTIKTIIRSNPGLVVLSSGTIVQKLHYRSAHRLRFD